MGLRRCAVESTLFKQWLKNLQSETGILANGDMLLKHVLIQVALSLSLSLPLTTLINFTNYP